jgi:hypothetical protein
MNKIAPTLQVMVEWAKSVTDHEPTRAMLRDRGMIAAPWSDKSQKELRALLAVARDQDRLLTYCVGMVGGLGLVKRDIWDEFPVLAQSLRVRNRLAKVSK